MNPDRAADRADRQGGKTPRARQIDLIVLHCSATDRPETTAADIDRWHRNRGFSRIGYHFFIRSDGTLELGRELETPGAHAAGYNKNSIGICVNGLSKFNKAQFDSLRALLARLKPLYPSARLLGHRELSPDLDHDGRISPNEYTKLCPVYDTGPFKEFWVSLETKPDAAKTRR